MRAFVTLLVLALVAARAGADPAADVVIGELELVRVVDGDTLRVKGLDSSLRLLGIDTEETFKHDKERRAYANGFAAYAKAARGTAMRPAKFATPLGDDAKRWAEAWFQGVATVRLERDDPHEVRDRYGRYLAYVLAEKHGKWLNYNVEAVRAGMSPYFPKYGRSRRFDRELVAAEAEAKAAKRGIWAPGAEAYPDYPEREAWWTARGDFVARFHAEAANLAAPASPRDPHRPVMIDLTHDDARARLAAEVGHEIVVLGVVGEIERPGARPKHRHGRADGDAADGDDPPSETRPSETRPRHDPPTRVMLDNHVPLVIFDPDVVAASGLSAWKGEWIRVTGTPSLYRGELEIAVDRSAQIELSPVPGLTRPTAASSARNREPSGPIAPP